MSSTNMKLDDIRAAVVAHLEERGIGDRAFHQEIRDGKRDNSPFMIGAIAWERKVAQAMAASGDGPL